MPSFDAARALTETLLASQRPDLWERAQRAAIRAREVAAETGTNRDLLMVAAVLYPIGGSPTVRRTGDPRADAARFLEIRGYDPRVVALVGGRGDGTDPVAEALRRCLAGADEPDEPPPDEPPHQV